MGGTVPICPFCRKLLTSVKDHVKAKHPERYSEWLADGQQPYWRYAEGRLREQQT